MLQPLLQDESKKCLTITASSGINQQTKSTFYKSEAFFSDPPCTTTHYYKNPNHYFTRIPRVNFVSCTIPQMRNKFFTMMYIRIFMELPQCFSSPVGNIRPIYLYIFRRERITVVMLMQRGRILHINLRKPFLIVITYHRSFLVIKYL